MYVLSGMKENYGSARNSIGISLVYSSTLHWILDIYPRDKIPSHLTLLQPLSNPYQIQIQIPGDNTCSSGHTRCPKRLTISWRDRVSKKTSNSLIYKRIKSYFWVLNLQEAFWDTLYQTNKYIFIHIQYTYFIIIFKKVAHHMYVTRKIFLNLILR